MWQAYPDTDPDGRIVLNLLTIWGTPAHDLLAVGLEPMFSHIHSYQHDLPRMTNLSPTGGGYMTRFVRKVIMTSQKNTPKRQRRMARFF